jgi:hypothetical protein
MKNIVKFTGFGNDNDYLYFSLEDLIKLEKITGKTVIEIWDDSNNGKFGLTMIAQGLLIGLADCRKGLTEGEVLRELAKAAENGTSIVKFITPIFLALTESGIFGGKKQAPQTIEEKEPGSAVPANGRSRSKKSRTDS